MMMMVIMMMMMMTMATKMMMMMMMMMQVCTHFLSSCQWHIKSCGSFVLIPRERDRKASKSKIRKMSEKANNNAETEEILTCPLPPPAASTAGPYHHPTIHPDHTLLDYLNALGDLVWVLLSIKKNYSSSCGLAQILTLKGPITTAADENFFYFFFLLFFR